MEGEIVEINGEKFFMIKAIPFDGPIIIHTPIEVMGKLSDCESWTYTGTKIE